MYILVGYLYSSGLYVLMGYFSSGGLCSLLLSLSLSLSSLSSLSLSLSCTCGACACACACACNLGLPVYFAQRLSFVVFGLFKICDSIKSRPTINICNISINNYVSAACYGTKYNLLFQ